MPQSTLLTIPAAIVDNLESLPVDVEYQPSAVLAIHLPGKGGTCQITGESAAKLLSTSAGVNVLIEGCAELGAELDEIALEIHGVDLDEDGEVISQLEETFSAVDLQ